MLDPSRERPADAVFLHAACGRDGEGGNRVYSVAALALSPEGRADRFSSLVRYGKVTERERHHSNVTREQLASAPAPEEVALSLRRFLEGRGPVFALESFSDFGELRRFAGDLRVVDLNFAVEFFLPFLPSSSPKNLWEHLHGRRREKVSMSSDEMVDLSFEAVRHLCGVVLNDVENPAAAVLRFYLAASDTLLGAALLELNRDYRRRFGGLFDARRGEDHGEWQALLERCGKGGAPPAERGEVSPLPAGKLDELFRGLEEAGGGFVFREGQVRFGRQVAEALNDGAVLAVEAGTGTGKTLGYLLPLFEFLRRNEGARAAVSTYTRSLQDQVFQQEIARIRGIFGVYRDIPASLLKGKTSCICAEKLDAAYEEGARGARALSWLFLVNLLFHHRRADLGSVGGRVAGRLDGDGSLTRLAAEVSARSGCARHHARCPAQVMAAEARGARLVVTNHHKLALLDGDPQLRDLFPICVIDEANHYESAVRGAFALEVTSREIADGLSFLEGACRRLRGRSAGRWGEAVGGALDEASLAAGEVVKFGDFLRAAGFGGPGGGETMIDAAGDETLLETVEHHLRPLAASVEEVCRLLSFLEDKEARGTVGLRRRTADRIRSVLSILAESSASLRALLQNLRDGRYLVTARVWVKNWTLKGCVMDVAPLIREGLLSKKEAVVFTSATLRWKDSFDIFSGITGLGEAREGDGEDAPGRDVRFGAFPSPYDPEHLEVTVLEGAESGEFRNKERWLDSVVAALPGLVKANRGRTLVLFASYTDLRLTAERTVEEITAAGFPVLVQQERQPTTDLCDEFRAVKESVLFGVDSFWYGVDFPGDTLTQVIITRVPYPSPRDPLQVVRERNMPRRDYWRRYRYDTAIRMRQGIGRLVRKETDRGRVVFLDSRASRFLDGP